MLDYKRIGERIRILRNGAGLSLADLAACVGMSAEDFSACEQGTPGFDLDAMFKISIVFQISLEQLMGNIASTDKPEKPAAATTHKRMRI